MLGYNYGSGGFEYSTERNRMIIPMMNYLSKNGVQYP